MIESRKTGTPTVWPGMVMAMPKLAATSTTQLLCTGTRSITRLARSLLIYWVLAI